MPKIIKLSNSVIPKIAAGEVVDRPASIVKELLENSIDAGAKNIHIELENGGIDLIKIVDDGSGMEKEDLEFSYLHHTTSKLSTIEDLTNLNTYGFRGEALSSIASVSRITIKSRPHNQSSGFELALDFGKPQNIKPCSMDYGTTIIVKDLFGNVPARKKFLKSSTIEYKFILKVLTAFIIAHPWLNINVSHDGKDVFSARKLSEYSDRLNFVFGKNISNSLFPFNLDLDRFSIKGYLSKPQVATTSNLNQYIIVNGRHIRSALINSVLREAYGSFLEPKFMPPFLINITIDAGLIDINVHPRKEEIRFWNDSEVYGQLFTAIKTILASNDISFSYNTNDIQGVPLKHKASKSAFIKLKDAVSRWEPHSLENVPAADPFQFERSYIVYSRNSELIFIDQHAAHESILFSQYRDAFLSEKKFDAIYNFEEPTLVSLSIVDFSTLFEHKNVLNSMGFEFEDFGTNSIKVTHIPAIFKSYDLNKLLIELSENLSISPRNTPIDSQSLNTLEFLSCRGAIKAGDFLDISEMKNIINKLNDNPNLYNTCPHGRPVKVILSIRDLEKMFYRR